MKARKSPSKEDRKEKDVLKNLGAFIEGHFKKGIDKVEQLFADDKASDDRLFSYFKAFVDDKGVASVTPSTRYLIERVLKAMDVKGARVIIEYGAASGVITQRLLEVMPANCKLIAIELNDALYGGLTRLRDPRLFPVNGDVREVVEIAKRHGVGLGEADVIVSGIPFAFLSGRGRHELLKATHDLLKPSGRFVAYQVTTHLIHLLDDYFKKVKTQFEIRNLPPHFVFTAFK